MQKRKYKNCSVLLILLLLLLTMIYISLRSSRKRGGGRGARTREKGDWGLGTKERLLQRPQFFISAAASGRKILIG